QSPKGGAVACTGDTITLTVVQSLGTSPTPSGSPSVSSTVVP
ncbi:MAG: hypothetical protein QOJ93_2206, partial [Actinomycetota bacterium]|nr:hypothetical protein [Actinomycetota bacterium]